MKSFLDKRSKEFRTGWRDYWVGYNLKECPYKDEIRRLDWAQGWARARGVVVDNSSEVVQLKPSPAAKGLDE